MKAEGRSAQRCAASRQFAGQTRYTRRPLRERGESNITLVLSGGCSGVQDRKTKGRGRLPGSFRVSFQRSSEASLEISFEWSFQRSFDASFRLSFEASDETSDALSFETNDARCDAMSIEMSDGRSDAVSFRVSVLRSFDGNFLTSFQGSVQRDFRFPIDDCRLTDSGQRLAVSGQRTNPRIAQEIPRLALLPRNDTATGLFVTLRL